MSSFPRFSHSKPVIESLERRRLLAADFGYALQFDSDSPSEANAVAIDRFGNQYVAGTFTKTIDFNPSPRRQHLITASGGRDVYVAKYAADGSLLWAVTTTGASDELATTIAVDRAGNAYVSGAFTGSADFRPGRRSFAMTSAGGTDAFLWKIDANGAFLNAIRGGGTGAESISNLALDPSGNLVATGNLASASNADFGRTILGAVGLEDVLLLKTDANLNLLLATRIGGTGLDTGGGIATDLNGNLYLTGQFSGTVDFHPGATKVRNLTSAGTKDAFLLKLDPAGGLGFMQQYGGAGDTAGGLAVAVDRFGGIFMTGSFAGSPDFNPNPSITVNLTSAGFTDAFVAKLDPIGGLVWARQAGAESDGASGRSITVDKAGNAYVGGDVFARASFGTGTPIGTTPTTGGSFIWKLTSGGTTAAARLFEHQGVVMPGVVYGFGIAIDSAGSMFLAGSFEKEVDVDPGPARYVFESFPEYEGSDGYLVKLLA